MESNLDMNSYKIINLAAPTNNTDAVRFQDIGDAVAASVAADASAAAADASATAATSATNASNSATAAASSATSASNSGYYSYIRSSNSFSILRRYSFYVRYVHFNG